MNKRRIVNSANPKRSLSRSRPESKISRQFSIDKKKNNSLKYLKNYKEKNEISEQKLA